MTGVSPAELEPITARAWPAVWEERLGDWRLLASRGYSRRINACWALGDPGLPLETAVARAEAWYAARALPPVFKLIDADLRSEEISAHLTALGYQRRVPVQVMIGPVPGQAEPGVSTLSTVNDDFMAVFAAGSGDPGDSRERLAALSRVPSPRVFALADVNGAPAAIGACAIEGEWVGLFAMRTVPQHRRAGHARRILSTLLAAAHAAGARRAWLQVEGGNIAALAFYAGAGFETAYSYSYWSRVGD